MMASNTTGSFFLYLAIVATLLLARENKSHVLGAASIGVCLLFLDLPDIAEYKEHYKLAEQNGFEYIFALYNFEPGYVTAVVISSLLMPFEVFYVVVITLAIHAYSKYYSQNTDNQAYIFTAIFLAICLYFIAFTIRTTIASIFLAYSLSYLKNKKNIYAALLIIIGSTFHAVIAPLIILPIINYFSVFISRRYLAIYMVAIALPLIIAKITSLDSFVGINELTDLKISAYQDANISSNSVYFGLWIAAALGSLISIRRFNELDRVLVVGLVSIILMLHPYEFIQGRFMWLTSFLFIYIFTKGTIARFDLGKTGRLLFLITAPLVTFLRF